jgi:hypothetical protein
MIRLLRTRVDVLASPRAKTISISRLLVCLILLSRFLVTLPAVRAQNSYRTQRSLRAPAHISDDTKPDASNEPAHILPLRFLGWNEAAKQGPESVKYFLSLNQWRTMSSQMRGISTAPSRQVATLALSNLPGFSPRPSLPAGLLPSSVATGDFNGDGKLDWVIGNGGDNSLYVYLGNGDGTSQLPFIIPLAGKSPTAVATADLNGDGRLDLVVTESDTKSVGILFGNGDGTFQPEIELPQFPMATFSVAVSDVNRDGHPDLIIGTIQTATTGELAVLLNDGKGNFGPPIYSSSQFVSPSAMEISVGDVNNDGKPDVLVTGTEVTQIFLGNGDGSFIAGQVIYQGQGGSVPKNPNNALLADVNGDGCLDAVAVDTFTEAVIFLGNCKGGFNNTNAGALVYGMGDVGYGLAVADLNGDGHPDLVIGGVPAYPSPLFGSLTGDTVGVRMNDGTGHFGPLHVYRGDEGMYALAVADLAGKGRPDIITTNQNANSTTVYLNDGVGGFGEPSGGYDGEYEGAVNGFFNSPSSEVFPFDVNGDGLPDLTLIELPDNSTNLKQTTVLLNQGNGQFGPPVRTPMLNPNYNVGDFVFADFRNVGQKDFVGIAFDDTGNCGAPQLVFAENQGNGKFGVPVQMALTIQNPCASFPVLAVGDFNNDGKPDFAVTLWTPAANNPFQLTIFLNQGAGTFKQGSPISFGSPGGVGPWPQAIFVGDANADGKQDIFVWLDDNTFGSSITRNPKDLLLFLGNGDGTFQAGRDALQSLDYMTMVDLNHDGLLDVIQIETTGQWGITPPVITIYLGNPDGTFGPPTTYSHYTAPFATFYGNNVTQKVQGPFVGDFNGDGNTDIAVIEASNSGLPSYVQYLAGNGDGTFTPTFDVFSLGIRLAPDGVVANAFGDRRTAFLQTPNFPASFHLLPDAPAAVVQLSILETPVLARSDVVTLSMNTVSASDTVVQLTASDPGVITPSTVTIPAGKLSLDVPFTLASRFPSGHWFSITATTAGTISTVYDFTPVAGSAGPFSMILLTNGSNLPPGTAAVPAPGQGSSWNAFVTASGEASSVFQPTCSSLPTLVSCGTFSPPSFTVTPNSTSGTGFILNTSLTMAPGGYPFTVTATDGLTSLSAQGTLDVGDFTIGISPGLVTTSSNGVATFKLDLEPLYGYSQPPTLSCTNLPSGATCNGLQFIGGYGQAPFTVNLNNVPAGTYTITVKATSNSLTHSATAQFQIVNNPFVTLNPTQVLIQPVLVGSISSQALQLTNSGTGTLSITSTTSATTAGGSGTFSSTSTCPSSLASLASCTITVSFSASSVGSAVGTLTIDDNASGSPHVVSLSAAAVNFTLQPGAGCFTAQTISAGQSAAFCLQIVPTQFQTQTQNLFASVPISCSGAPMESHCLAPAQLMVSGTMPIPFQVTVTTTAASSAVPPSPGELFGRFDPSPLAFVAIAVFLGLGFLNCLFLRRTRLSAFRILLPLALLAGVLLAESCGSGSQNASTGNSGTPHGAYTITVNAVMNGSARTIQVSLTVK